jgi:putative MFS transporter
MRFLVGIGLGIELVTIDAYLGTGAQAHAQFGVCLRLFRAVSLGAGGSVDVVVAGAAGAVRVSGWRWVVLASAVFALFIWWLRKRLPESPRWLAQHGRFDEANRILDDIEARCERITANRWMRPKPFRWMSRARPLRRYLATAVSASRVDADRFHVFQAIGFFGFGNWLPALLSGQGVSVTHSLMYAFIITLAYPLGPLLFVKFANRFENKWQIVGSALGAMTFGTLFAWQTSAFGLISAG